MARERKTREACVYKEGGKYHITDLGYAQICEWGALGGGAKEIARYFNISTTTVQRWFDEDGDGFRPDVLEVYDEGRSEFEKRLLKAQQCLSETNAQMAIHMGKIHLGQKEDPQEHVHTHHVVGTLPDYSQTSDEWRKQFAPDAVQAIPLEGKTVATDAEYEEVKGD